MLEPGHVEPSQEGRICTRHKPLGESRVIRRRLSMKEVVGMQGDMDGNLV